MTRGSWNAMALGCGVWFLQLADRKCLFCGWVEWLTFRYTCDCPCLTGLTAGRLVISGGGWTGMMPAISNPCDLSDVF